MFPLNTFENLCVFFLLLMIYSAAGWVGEMFYCSVGKGHICEKRGFLNGLSAPSMDTAPFWCYMYYTGA